MIAVKFLALFLYISVTMSFQLDPEESAKEKAKATLFGLDYLKGHCILTEDYDNILICRCAAIEKCADYNYPDCDSDLNVVMSSLVTYMAIFCTAIYLQDEVPAQLQLLQARMATIPQSDSNMSISFPHCDCDN